MDVATELRKARADMIGTADESLYRACHSAADELGRLRAEMDALHYVLRVYVYARRGGEWHQPVEDMALALLTPNAEVSGGGTPSA